MSVIERASVCTFDCPDTCSLSVTVEDGRITKVRGSEATPFTAGVICNKVARDMTAFVHGPQRFPPARLRVMKTLQPPQRLVEVVTVRLLRQLRVQHHSVGLAPHCCSHLLMSPRCSDRRTVSVNELIET